MSIKSIKVHISSVSITREFLKKLGKIVEREIRFREKENENEIQKEIEKRTNEILSRDYLSDEGKKQEIEDLKEHTEYIERLQYTLEITINTPDETVKFSSFRDLLETTFFPSNIRKMSLILNHYDNKYVDMYILFDKDGGSYFELSSEKEPNLLKFKKDLEDLLENFSTSYIWVYKHVFASGILIGLFLGIFAFISLYYKLKLQTSLIILITSILYIVVLYLLFEIYPPIEFDIDKKNTRRKTIRNILEVIFWGIITSLIGGTLYSIFF